MATGHPVVNVSPNNPVFDLPIYVARDEGLFERAGIEVRFQAKYSQRNASDKEAFSRLKESLFEQGKADVYNLCEWAGIDRSERSTRGAQVLALRPAVGAQAILSFDAAIQEPRDLAGVAVGINDRTGSHYTTLQSLEGVLAQQALGDRLERGHDELLVRTVDQRCRSRTQHGGARPRPGQAELRARGAPDQLDVTQRPRRPRPRDLR